MTEKMPDAMSQEIRDRLIALEVSHHESTKVLGRVAETQDHIVKAIERISSNQEHLSSLGVRVHTVEHQVTTIDGRVAAVEQWIDSNRRLPQRVDQLDRIARVLVWLATTTAGAFTIASATYIVQTWGG